ncbi:FAD-binding oxidoreductase [Actinoplanes sp. TBRC 11911]|uniref:FAD-binding oxidoreductase n=1 Tax=Actinoplanes sp. TBRC 11911 TaxID=2729386 RepID=UPI00145CCD8C|nr:FAD-binding oxidoreductase [Actinoplanes sp. TBRC 11911]NMO55879.1 FAD-binding oxidoreductase [Actinoplanes sp. TBRC 11911]
MTALPVSLDDRAVLPGDSRYPLLRSTYTTRHSPAVVILARSHEDIREALAYARKSGLEVAVRSGGHGLSGSSSNDGGLVIDLSEMNGVRVLDRGARLVAIGAGARWATVAGVLHAHGLSISSGDHGNVGVGGLATAGGIGWMVRKFGLTVDRMRSATLVLADGSVRTVDDRSHPELFWAVRGGGGFVGIVTEFVFEAVEVTAVTVTQLTFEGAAATDALARWDAIMRAAPRELTTTIMLHPDGGVLTVVWAGDDIPAAEAAIRPLRRLGRRPSGGKLQVIPYAALVPGAHLHPNVGQMPAVTRNGMVDELDTTVQDLVLAAATEPDLMMQLRSLGGAMFDVVADATAFGNRHQSALVIATTFAPSTWATLDRRWAPLEPHFTGAYGNFESRPTVASLRLAYPAATRKRLRELKSRYDPEGVLRALP